MIGEAPGGEESREACGFVGEAGQRLRRMLADEGFSCSEYGVANVCRCQPPSNRRPCATEIDACLPFLASLITELRPKVILAVGARTAVAVLCGSGSLNEKLSARRADGKWYANRVDARPRRLIKEALKSVSFVVPMPHTSRQVRSGTAPHGETWKCIEKQQVSLAASLLKKTERAP